MKIPPRINQKNAHLKFWSKLRFKTTLKMNKAFQVVKKVLAFRKRTVVKTPEVVTIRPVLQVVVT